MVIYLYFKLVQIIAERAMRKNVSHAVGVQMRAGLMR